MMGFRQGQKVEITATGEKGRVHGPHEITNLYILDMDSGEQRVVGKTYLKMVPDLIEEREAYVALFCAPPKGETLDRDSYYVGVMDERGRILEALAEVYKHAPDEGIPTLETMRECIEKGDLA